MKWIDVDVELPKDDGYYILMSFANFSIPSVGRYVGAWKKALFEEAGVLIEMPIDPLTQTSGSLMTG